MKNQRIFILIFSCLFASTYCMDERADAPKELTDIPMKEIKSIEDLTQFSNKMIAYKARHIGWDSGPYKDLRYGYLKKFVCSTVHGKTVEHEIKAFINEGKDFSDPILEIILSESNDEYSHWRGEKIYMRLLTRQEINMIKDGLDSGEYDIAYSSVNLLKSELLSKLTKEEIQDPKLITTVSDLPIRSLPRPDFHGTVQYHDCDGVENPKGQSINTTRELSGWYNVFESESLNDNAYNAYHKAFSKEKK